MNDLSEALKRLENTLAEREQRESTSRTQRLGLTASAGKLTTPLKEPEEVLTPEMLIKMDSPKTLGEVICLPQNGSLKVIDLPQSTGPRHSESDKAQLAETLGRVCALQSQYGKTAAELETLVEGFCWILSDYSMNGIIGAIATYIKKHADIPKPADIESILNPPLPKPDWAAFVSLKKKLRDGNIYVSSEEREYCNWCEQYAVENRQEQQQAYTEARRLLEQDAALRALTFNTEHEGDIE